MIVFKQHNMNLIPNASPAGKEKYLAGYIVQKIVYPLRDMQIYEKSP